MCSVVRSGSWVSVCVHKVMYVRLYLLCILHGDAYALEHMEFSGVYEYGVHLDFIHSRTSTAPVCVHLCPSHQHTTTYAVYGALT